MAKVLIKKWGAHINALRGKGLPLELIEILEGLEEQDRLVNNRVEEVRTEVILEGVPFGPGQLIGLQAPKATDFSWDNQGTSTVVYSAKSGILSADPLAANSFRVLRQGIPTGKFTIIAWLSAFQYEVSSQVTGLVLYYDATTKIRCIGMETQNTGTQFLIVLSAPAVTGGPITVDVQTLASSNWFSCGMFFRIQCDGTDITWSYSFEGDNWIQLYTNAMGADVPSYWGFFGYREVNDACRTCLLGYKVTIP